MSLFPELTQHTKELLTKLNNSVTKEDNFEYFVNHNSNPPIWIGKMNFVNRALPSGKIVQGLIPEWEHIKIND